nr:PEF-CTERM sorting domain-containing protein [uncultured Methanolobus sp.]
MKKMTKLSTIAFVLLLMLTAVQPAIATETCQPAPTYTIPDGCYCVNLDGEYSVDASNLNMNQIDLNIIVSAFFAEYPLPFDYIVPVDFPLLAPYTLTEDYKTTVTIVLTTPIEINGYLFSVIPAGTIIPAGTVIPAGTIIPAGTVIPEGSTLPVGYIIPSSVTIPMEYEATADLKVCKSGENVAVTIVSSTPSVPEGFPNNFAIQITDVQITAIGQKLQFIATMSPVNANVAFGDYTFTGEMDLDIQENGKLIYSTAEGLINGIIPVDASLTMTVKNCSQEEIPEFPTIAIPVAAIIGLAFFMQRRKD